jgi:pyruvate,orthophosphate dikinase
MVFGNMGDDCATGVGFTRNPGTGENEMFGEYLTNAQGEDTWFMNGTTAFSAKHVC